MATVKPTALLRKLITLIGVNKSESIKFRFLLFTYLSLYFLLQALACIIISWDDATSRYAAMEDFEHSLTCSWFMLYMLFRPNQLFRMLEIIDNDYFAYKNLIVSEEKNKIIVDNLNRSYNMVRGLAALIFCFIMPNCVLPLLFSIYNLSKNDLIDSENMHNIKFNVTNNDYDLPLPYENWLPFKLKNPILYLLICSVHLFYGQYIYFSASSIILASTVTMLKRSACEIRLLQVSIKEVDEIFKDSNFYHCNDNILNGVRHEEELQLRNHQRELIENHKFVIRTIKLANEVMSIPSLGMNQASALFGCLSLYKAIESENIMESFKNWLLVVAAIAITYFYCVYGQEIQNEDEKLRTTLAEFNWVNKPRWFKKCHHIMMIRSNIILEIRPFNLFVLNYGNFTNVMNAAYSYSNVLLTVRKK